MLARSEDALICDFAETYHIYNWRALPLRMAATLAAGLRDDSRIKMLLSGARFGTDVLLLAGIADRLSILAWQNTEDGHKGRNRPKMLVDTMQNRKASMQTVSYASADEYLAARKKIQEAIINGGD